MGSAAPYNLYPTSGALDAGASGACLAAGGSVKTAVSPTPRALHHALLDAQPHGYGQAQRLVHGHALHARLPPALAHARAAGCALLSLCPAPRRTCCRRAWRRCWQTPWGRHWL